MRSVAALVIVSTLAGCASSPSARRTGISVSRAQLHDQAADASERLFRRFAVDGADALIELRLRPDEWPALFEPETVQRIAQVQPGRLPSGSEVRWRSFHDAGPRGLVGWCARGVRVAEPHGIDGLRSRGVVIDRLLLVGRDAGGTWASWVEHVVDTPRGWRLLPLVSFDRQVEVPRIDHADVGLWDCDTGSLPSGSVSNP